MMNVQEESNKLIEELEKENKELREKLGKCKKLLRMATEDIRKMIIDEHNRNVCKFCSRGKVLKCGKIIVSGIFNDCMDAEWTHADEVREVMEDERVNSL